VNAHHGWLELAVSEPAFRLDPSERRDLDRHLAHCDDCARVVTGLRSDARRLADLSIPVPPDLRSRALDGGLVVTARPSIGLFRLALLLGLLGAVTIGMSIVAFGGGGKSPPALDAGPKLIEWANGVVRLRADGLRIDVGGTELTAPGRVTVGGDPGTLRSWTLETSWQEAGQEQRINVYFAADTNAWWASEIRVYDHGDWATFAPGPYFRSPLGVPWTGNIDVTGDGASGPVRLRIDGADLSVTPRISYAAPAGGGRPLPVDSNPFAAGGPLHCSGILELSPKEAHQRLLALGYRVSWRAVINDGTYWDQRTEPPEGVISKSYDPIVGTDGAIIIAVFPVGAPQAVPHVRPADCP
jgi:hypothetical protein